MLLKDKVVLVTGSTTGIGRAIARRAVAEGAKVMIHGRNRERAQKLQQELGQRTQICIVDLLDPNIVDKLIQATLHAFGRIDVLVNNAGIYPRNNIDELSEELYENVMRVNFKVPMFLIQAAVKCFRKHGGGTVVNIGSINAHCGQSDLLVYSASKGALMTSTRNLGDSLGSENIRVNQLNVGWTITETERQVQGKEGAPDNWEELLPKIFAPQGRLLRPENVAAHAVFWASDQSAPANGQVYELEQYPLMGRNLINRIIK